jgi:ubiquinol-cytochrome c reductase cytochrome b subunit
LRAIPNKLGGVIALVLSIAILFILPFTNNFKFQRIQFYPVNQNLFWLILITVILLTWIGARPVEDPFILTGQILTCVYFSYFIFNPIISKWWENKIF